MRALVIVLAALSIVCDVEPSEDIMRDIAKSFTKGLEECKKELNMDDSLMISLYHFWKEEYSYVGRDVGCMLLCMSQKLALVGDNSKMHHGNAAEFVKQHGADDALASKLVELIHGCEKEFDDVEDHCSRVLEVAKCFRTKIGQLQWTPSMKDVLEEIVIEQT